MDFNDNRKYAAKGRVTCKLLYKIRAKLLYKTAIKYDFF